MRNSVYFQNRIFTDIFICQFIFLVLWEKCFNLKNSSVSSISRHHNHDSFVKLSRNIPIRIIHVLFCHFDMVRIYWSLRSYLIYHIWFEIMGLFKFKSGICCHPFNSWRHVWFSIKPGSRLQSSLTDSTCELYL